MAGRTPLDTAAQRKERRLKGRTQARGRTPVSSATRKVNVVHGGKSKFVLNAPLDTRTRVGKAWKQYVEALHVHLGGNPTLPECRLADIASRHAVLGALAWQEMKGKPFNKDGSPKPAVEVYNRAAISETATLIKLGLKKQLKEIVPLQEYIKAQANDKK